jgi:hypothetical protein
LTDQLGPHLSRQARIGREIRDGDQVARDAVTKLDDTAIADNALAARQIDVHVVMLEEHSVKRMDRFENGLLRGKEQASGARLVAHRQSFAGRRDDVEQFVRQGLGWLHVNSQGPNTTSRGNGGDRDQPIVRERTNDTDGPDGRARRRSRQGAVRMAKPPEQFTRNDSRSPAGASSLNDVIGDSSRFFGQERFFIARCDQAMADADTRQSEFLDCGLQLRIRNDRHAPVL